jgi:hypothetical protein
VKRKGEENKKRERWRGGGRENRKERNDRKRWNRKKEQREK